ncbi:type II toxin-antitoxin system RelE/ParE family toxin [Pelagibacterium halotolerans]|uniref:type II toxin-antitoxin system RelE/ParE family toxin n=1 Tax=Pelagibacterium halotolerans TaxID=531813 RepID=UPI00384C4E34
MKRLIWSQEAEDDLEALTDYIALDDVMAAIRVRDELETQIARLQDYPFSGREGRLNGTRELIVVRTPFVVIYKVDDVVEVLRVLHGAQRWPGPP